MYLENYYLFRASSFVLRILTMLFGKGDQIALTTPALFVDRKYEEGKPDIDTAVQVNMPPELAHLARDFEDSLLEAASPFGKEKGVGDEINYK